MSERPQHHEKGLEIEGENPESILDRAQKAMSALRERAQALSAGSLARRVVFGGGMLIGLVAAGEARAHDRHGNGVSFNAEAHTEELAANLQDIEAELKDLRARFASMRQHVSTPPADLHAVQGRIKVLEKQEARAEAAMDKASEKWMEQRATHPKKQIDVAERATDETNALLISWGLVVSGNSISIPVGAGLYHEVILGPGVVDIGFPVRTNHEILIVLHNANRTFTTIRVVRDAATGLGIYSGDILDTDSHGRPLSQP